MKRRTQQRTDNELRSSINELRSSINNLIRAQPPAVQDAADSAAESAAESAADSAADSAAKSAKDFQGTSNILCYMDYDGEMRVVLDDSDDSDDSDMAALFAKEKAEEKAKEKALSPQSYVTHHPPASDDLSSDDLSTAVVTTCLVTTSTPRAHSRRSSIAV